MVGVLSVSSETCENLGTYLSKLYQMLPEDGTISKAVDLHPLSSRSDPELSVCSTDDTCCSSKSEQIMTGASTEIFQTFSISMAMQKIEDELRDLRKQVTRDIGEVGVSADGVVAGEAAKEYVLSQDIELDTVVRHRLVHLINTVYNTTWSSFCLDPLQGSRTLLAERSSVLLNHNRKILDGLLEGINKIPALKVLAISELSDSCSAALTKSSLFEGLGCKKCQDGTSTVKTCFNTCINVARGCLRPILCHTADWQSWAAKQDELVLELTELASKRGAFLDALIERFEMEFTTAVRDTEWNLAACSIDLDSKDTSKLEQFKSKEVSLPSLRPETHKSQFGGRLLALPDSVCSASSSVSDVQFEEDGECWNGERVAPYIHPTPQFSLQEQKCNPEVVPQQLQCDTMDMMCSSYDVFSTSPPREATEGAIVDPGNPSSGEVARLAYVICCITTLLWIVY